MKKSESRKTSKAIPGQGMVGGDPKRLKLILALVCAITAILLYANTRNHGYVLDDIAVIEKNRFTQQGLEGIPSMVTTFYWEGFWSLNAGLYRPLSLITFAVEHEFFPNNPSVSHTGNILCYAFIAFLLFYFLSILLKDKHPVLPFVATMVFVLHPIHTEVVANIKSRDELLCFLFFILSAIWWLRWHESRKTSHIILAAGAYFLCLFSKEGGLLFLPVFPLMLYFFRGVPPKAAFRGFWAVAAPAVLFLAIHTWVIQFSPHPRITYTYQDNAILAAENVAGRLATALSTIPIYLRLLLWPHPLSHDYSFNQVPVADFGTPATLAALAIILGLAWLAVRGWKARSLVSFSILYFAITFSLTSNLLTPIGATMAERFMFAPSLGLALLAGSFISRLSKGAGRAASAGAFVKENMKPVLALAVLALPLAALTVKRNAQWKDDLELFTADLQTAPNSARTHFNHATAYMNTVAHATSDPNQKVLEFKKVVSGLEKALAIDPNYYDALRNMGIACYYAGDYGRSVPYLEKAIKLIPGSGADQYWLGKALLRQNRFEAALAAFEKSLAEGARQEDTYNLMGTANFNLGRFDKAMEYYNQALEDNPAQPEVLNNLASAYGSMGKYAEAVTYLLRSHELDPKNASTCYFLAITYNNMGDGQNAEVWINKARALGMKV